MRLYIMRHGPAEDRAVSGRDFDRALTAAGRERVRDVARALHEGDEGPRTIVSSPLVRALQTAEIVAAMTGADVEVRRELSPEEDPLPLIAEKLGMRAKRVMVVGHEPDLADLFTHLSRRPLPAGLQKAMVVGLAPDKDDPAKLPMGLRFILDPKSLAWLDDAR